MLLTLLISGSAWSQSHILHHIVPSSGGGGSSSTSFVLRSTIGQTTSAPESSTSHFHGGGFAYLHEGIGRYYSGLLPVDAGWNMVSLSKEVPSNSLSSIFPSAISKAFRYAGGYQESDTLNHGVGFWIKFGSVQAISITGIPLDEETLRVAAKWNLIGSIGFPAPVTSIIQIPDSIILSQFYSYDDGYTAATILHPGRAYWVKTRASGQLVLRAPTSFYPSSMLARSDENLEILNKLTVSMSGGVSSKSLYFGVGESNVDQSKYELPPPPPRGATDVRFSSSNSAVELFQHSSTLQTEYPITIQSPAAEIHFASEISETDGLTYTLIEHTGESITNYFPLKGHSSLLLRPKDNMRYALRVELKPLQFALHQNYPNPFNPTTSIRVELPTEGTVSLLVYNILGQKIMTLIDQELRSEGRYAKTFDGANLPSGIYFYRLTVVGTDDKILHHQTRKMVLIK